MSNFKKSDKNMYSLNPGCLRKVNKIYVENIENEDILKQIENRQCEPSLRTIIASGLKHMKYACVHKFMIQIANRVVTLPSKVFFILETDIFFKKYIKNLPCLSYVPVAMIKQMPRSRKFVFTKVFQSRNKGVRIPQFITPKSVAI